MSTITTKINHGIQFGIAGYDSPLTVTATGAVNNNGTSKAIFGGTATVVNEGTITATGNSGGYGYQGVYLGGGYVLNTGTITAASNAVELQAAGTVVNSGFIYGQRWGINGRGLASITNTGTIMAGNQGIAVFGGGFVNNSNLISGPQGVGIAGGFGTVENSGTITSYNPGVYIAGGTVTNTGLISVSGLYAAVGVDLGAGSVTNAGTLSGYIGALFSGNYNNTLIDTGTIIGSYSLAGGAVRFGSGNDLLRFNPSTSIVIQGVVDGGGGTNLLDFASGASAGTLTGAGADFIDFSFGTIDAGAYWRFKGSNTLGAGITLTNSGTLVQAGTLVDAGTIINGITLAGAASLLSITATGYVNDVTFKAAGTETLVITNDAALPARTSGFTGKSDTIDLTALSDIKNDATATLDRVTNVLTVTGDNGSVTLQLDAENYTGTIWTTRNDGGNGTDVTPLCFCAGTYIATPSGQERVENLRAGDRVRTAGGEAREITWIGTGRVLATRGRRNAATPVIVRKGALAPNVPHSDLHVTKGHSLYLDGVLVPVEFLVNHRSILWDDHAQEVSLYHVELEIHDVLVANGAPAESYRDDGNRWLFQNANAGWDQPPKAPCAEVLTGGPVVDAIWRRLLDRAGPRAGVPLTSDPDLHLLVDGCRLDAEGRTESAYVFRLPANARPGSIRIVSRAAVAAELGLARDPRVLGIALRRIVVRSGSKFHVVDARDDRLVDGFHHGESTAGIRWTDGDASLPLALLQGFGGPIELVLHLGGTTQYRADERVGRTAA
jgi:hypothetical protein